LTETTDTQDALETSLRLQVYLAHAGAASRRGAEKLIASGRVTVNGIAVDSMGVKVKPQDEVLLDGKPVKPETMFHYLVLNKPSGFICASSDPQGRPLAMELLPPVKERLYNVGRLDYLSCGLIFFTNDGAFAARAGHPSSNIEKEYLVESTVPIPFQFKEEFMSGLMIDGVMYRAREIELLGRKNVRIVLTEGKNREIRKVFSRFRLHPKMLRRIRIGPVILGDLEEGKSRPIEKKELGILTEECKWL
jgi:23S rRNA pseudouridine2605 synthase